MKKSSLDKAEIMEPLREGMLRWLSRSEIAPGMPDGITDEDYQYIVEQGAEQYEFGNCVASAAAACVASILGVGLGYSLDKIVREVMLTGPRGGSCKHRGLMSRRNAAIYILAVTLGAIEDHETIKQKGDPIVLNEVVFNDKRALLDGLESAFRASFMYSEEGQNGVSGVIRLAADVLMKLHRRASNAEQYETLLEEIAEQIEVRFSAAAGNWASDEEGQELVQRLDDVTINEMGWSPIVTRISVAMIAMLSAVLMGAVEIEDYLDFEGWIKAKMDAVGDDVIMEAALRFFLELRDMHWGIELGEKV